MRYVASVMQHTAAHYNTLQRKQHTATHLAVLQQVLHALRGIGNAAHCNTLQHTAAHCNACNTLQHTSPYCNKFCMRHVASVMQVPVLVATTICNNTMQRTTIHCNTCNTCNTLHHTSTDCNTPQRTATRRTDTWYMSCRSHCSLTPLPATTHCSTLQHMQHTASHVNTCTHCNTLQHTATHLIALQQVVHALHGITNASANARCRQCSFASTICNNTVAAYYNTWQHMQHMQHTASHVNKLQHTSTHCNTLSISYGL